MLMTQDTPNSWQELSVRETGEAGHTIVSVFESEASPQHMCRQQQQGGGGAGSAHMAGEEAAAAATLQQALLRELIHYCNSTGAIPASLTSFVCNFSLLCVAVRASRTTGGLVRHALLHLGFGL